MSLTPVNVLLRADDQRFRHRMLYCDVLVCDAVVVGRNVSDVMMEALGSGASRGSGRPSAAFPPVS